jgi:hypothetical protein
MQQRQLRLGDILDDYCPRERRVTNHAVVAMVGPDVKQTRCTTCDAEHEYKHAKVPRQRRKPDAPAALYSQVLAGAPKRIAHESGDADNGGQDEIASENGAPAAEESVPVAAAPTTPPPEHGRDDIERSGEDDETEPEPVIEEGPVHRPLIRATLPRPEGQPPATRPAPDFTIRQPGGRPNRFRHRHARGGQQFGNRSNGNMGGGGPMRGMPRPGGGRPPHGAGPRPARRHGPKRQK